MAEPPVSVLSVSHSVAAAEHRAAKPKAAAKVVRAEPQAQAILLQAVHPARWASIATHPSRLMWAGQAAVAPAITAAAACQRPRLQAVLLVPQGGTTALAGAAALSQMLV